MAKTQKECIELDRYKGRVKIRFYPESHQYWVSVDGGKITRKGGVTSIIGIKDKSKALGIWQQGITVDFLLKQIEKGVKIDADLAIEAAIQNDVLRDEAADIGHEIHSWCEHYIRHKLKQKGFETMPEIPDFPEAITGVESFLAWVKKHDVEFFSTEEIVYSLEGDYIGCMDFEAKIDGMMCVGDFKSSNGLYNGVRAQTAAYGRAMEEERGKKLYKGRWAIRLSKYTEAEYYKREARKAQIKEKIAQLKGTKYTYYPPKPYKVFEAKFLDDNKGNFDRDAAAFKTMQDLHEWDKATDPFIQGDNW